MDVSVLNQQYIGEGIKDPNIFDSVTGGISTNSGLDRINQSIYEILGTPIGTRYFLPSFGSKLYLLAFEPNDLIFQDLARLYITDALNQWEKRISIISINVESSKDSNQNITPIQIVYQLKNSNLTGSFVYPMNREIYDIGGGNSGN